MQSKAALPRCFEHPTPSALGYFIIHVGGRAYGVREPEASLLGCSFDGVEHRLWRRGTHLLPLSAGVSAAELASAYLDLIYRDNARSDYFGLSPRQFEDALFSSGVIWAPDGDEAFDDGSHVLQFDVGTHVRIVAFSNTEEPDELAQTVREEWIHADLFYATVSCWKVLFSAEFTGLLVAKAATAH